MSERRAVCDITEGLELHQCVLQLTLGDGAALTQRTGARVSVKKKMSCILTNKEKKNMSVTDQRRRRKGDRKKDLKKSEVRSRDAAILPALAL